MNLSGIRSWARTSVLFVTTLMLAGVAGWLLYVSTTRVFEGDLAFYPTASAFAKESANPLSIVLLTIVALAVCITAFLTQEST